MTQHDGQWLDRMYNNRALVPDFADYLGRWSAASAEALRVRKMRFVGSGKALDRSAIIVNNQVTLAGIPAEAHSYTVNGKSALDWLIDRYQVTTNKDSGIVNDPNLYCDDPRYIVDLVASMVRVSVESVRIINSLPKLEIIEYEPATSRGSRP